jgi:putative ABC transport system permease protein
MIRKYLTFDKTNPFISISAILAFVGVCIGVMVLIITMAVMRGLSEEFESKLFVMNYPLTLTSVYSDGVDEELLLRIEKKFPNMLFSPYRSSQVMIQSGGQISAGLLFGVDPKREKLVNSIYKKAISDVNLDNKYHLIVGDGFKKDLFLHSGKKVTLYFSLLDPAGLSLMPKLKRFTYASSFKSGLMAYDSGYLYTSLKSVANMANKNEKHYDGIHIYSKEPKADMALLRQEFKNKEDFHLGIVGWWEQNGNFFAAMELEKRAMLVVLMLIVIVASLNILSSLLMTLMSRRKEIALLLSMGANAKEIKKIFLNLGLYIGVFGIIFGIILGFLGIYILDTTNLISLPEDVYGTSNLNLSLGMGDFSIIVLGSLIVVFLFSYYPAKLATKLNVLDVLRNE